MITKIELIFGCFISCSWSHRLVHVFQSPHSLLGHSISEANPYSHCFNSAHSILKGVKETGFRRSDEKLVPGPKRPSPMAGSVCEILSTSSASCEARTH